MFESIIFLLPKAKGVIVPYKVAQTPLQIQTFKKPSVEATSAHGNLRVPTPPIVTYFVQEIAGLNLVGG